MVETAAPQNCGHAAAHADELRRTLRMRPRPLLRNYACYSCLVDDRMAGTQFRIETQTALPALVDGAPCLCLRISAAEYNSMAEYELLPLTRAPCFCIDAVRSGTSSCWRRCASTCERNVIDVECRSERLLYSKTRPVVFIVLTHVLNREIAGLLWA
jgi:hypothetical protein